MKRNWSSEEQIIGHAAGISVSDLCRRHGVSEAKPLKGLADENARLQPRLADTMFNKAALKDLLGKRGKARRQVAARLVANHKMSERRACWIIGYCRTSVRYKTIRQEDVVLRDRLNTLAKERGQFGCRRLNIFLRY